MPRTPPSQADHALIQVLADRGVNVTAAQLERWRSGGYLPGNNRAGLGRGAGSRSEIAPGVVDYVEALASQAGQGRSMHRTMLTLFMAGVVQPQSDPASGPLISTYEAAIRRAFRREIDQGDRAWNRVADQAAADGRDPEEALDNAFAEAETVTRGYASRNRVRLDSLVANRTGTQARTAAELQSEREQALLSATGLIPPGFERNQDDRSFEEVWHTGLVPLDAAIFAQPPCNTCTSRTAHFPTSPQGRRDILDSVNFGQLNTARAIGGAVCTLVASIRDAALQAPDDQFLQGTMTLCSNTSFRFLLREARKVAPWRPESIVPCTLFFLNDCRWLRAGAALLTQIALWKMPSAGGDASLPAAVARTMTEVLARARILQLSEDGVGMLLAADGLVEAAELLKLAKPRS